MIVSRADFLMWVEHPVTEWVLGAFAKAGEQQRDDWIGVSWDGGSADDKVLTSLRERAMAYGAIADPSYEEMCEMHGQEAMEE